MKNRFLKVAVCLGLSFLLTPLVHADSNSDAREKAIALQRAEHEKKVEIHAHLVEQISKAEFEHRSGIAKVTIASTLGGASAVGIGTTGYSLLGDLRMGNIAYRKAGIVTIAVLGAVSVVSAVVLADQVVELSMTQKELARLAVQLHDKENELHASAEKLEALENAFELNLESSSDVEIIDTEEALKELRKKLNQ